MVKLPKAEEKDGGTVIATISFPKKDIKLFEWVQAQVGKPWLGLHNNSAVIRQCIRVAMQKGLGYENK